MKQILSKTILCVCSIYIFSSSAHVSAFVSSALHTASISTSHIAPPVSQRVKTLPAEDINTSETSKEKKASQRYNYEMAKSAIRKKNRQEFEHYYALLGDYPLTPYLDYALLKQEISALTLDRVNVFLAANKGDFLEIKARELVLYELAKNKDWANFQGYYNSDIKPKALKCHYLYAKLISQKSDISDDIESIWTQPKSQPKSCDPLFTLWKQRGGLTDQVAWVRFNAAIEKGNIGLARYVRSLMSNERQKLASLYLKIHGYPSLVKKTRLFDLKNPKHQQIIAHGIKRLSRTQPKTAMRHWEKYEAQQLFPEGLASGTKLYIAKQLTNKGYIAEAEHLVQQSSELKQSGMIERLIRESLKIQDWAKVTQWIDHLSIEKQESDRWMYWRARARDERLGNSNPTATNKIYQELAQKRSFYGFLAADKLGTPYSLTNHFDPIEPSTKAFVSQIPAIKRAKELWLRGNLSEAQAEWIFGTDQMSKKELQAAGELASKWGWYNKGIVAMIAGELWNHLDVRFPLAYQNEIQNASTKTKVSIPLIYAIARQESAFKESARSHVGAMGLMQLMPATAKQTARKNGVKMKLNELLNPQMNLNIGSHYLNELLNKYQGNRILAAAAYNAGPHRVSIWTKSTEHVPYDVWIETIPFKETRGYVQNILSFSVIYATKLGQTQPFITPSEAKSLL